MRTTDKRPWRGISGVSVTGVVGPGLGVVDDGGGEWGVQGYGTARWSMSAGEERDQTSEKAGKDGRLYVHLKN